MNLPDAFERIFLGRPLFRQSLRTKLYSEALRIAADVEQAFDAKVAEAMGRSLLPRISTTRQMTVAALGEVSSFVCSRIIREWRTIIIRANIDGEAAAYLDWRLEKFLGERDGGSYELALLSGSTPQEEASALNVSWGFNVDEKSMEFAELVAAVKDGCTEARKGVQNLFDGKALPDQPTSSLIKNFAQENPRSVYSRRFSEVATEHSKANNFAAKTLAKMRRAHQLFTRVVGDKPVGDITREDLHLFLDALAIQEVGKAGATGRKITRATVQSYLTQISSPLNFAIGRGWLAEPNPAMGLRVSHWIAAPNPQLQPKRRRFEISELNGLLNHPWFAGCQSSEASYAPGETLLDDMRYWAPIVALYTGARAGELGGLMLNEVLIDDPSPHLLIQCNKYRNTKSRRDRHVPIVDALLRLGFRDYVERVRFQGNDRLFPDWQLPSSGGTNSELFNWANTKWIRAFNRTVIPSALPHVAQRAGRSPVVFHSLRGSFKVLLLNSGPRHLANAILGHLQDDLDKAYVGLVTPAETYAAFKSVDYTGLKLPHRRVAASDPSPLQTAA